MKIDNLRQIVDELDTQIKTRSPLTGFVVLTVWPHKFSFDFYGGAGASIHCTGATAEEALAAARAELARDPVAEALACIGRNPDGSIMAEYLPEARRARAAAE